MTLLRERAEMLRNALDGITALEPALVDAAAAITSSIANGGTILVAGNGGSAAEAQHLSGELLGRLVATRERGPLPALALHADTSAVTAIANDYGYEQVFARQVEALGRAGDVLLAISTSGRSPNLVAAADVANARGVVTVGLLGPGPSPLHERCTHVLAVDAPSMQTVQECHLVLVHVLAEQVEDGLAGSPTREGGTATGSVVSPE